MIAMRPVAIMLVVLLVGCGRQSPPSPPRPTELPAFDVSEVVLPDEPAVLTYVVKTDRHVHFEYEGIGSPKERGSTMELEMSPITNFKFIAHYIPRGATFMAGGINDHPRRQVVEFKGTMDLDDKNHVAIDGKLMTKIPLKLRFMWITTEPVDDTKEPADDDVHELTFVPGRHDVQFEGTVTGYVEYDRFKK